MENDEFFSVNESFLARKMKWEKDLNMQMHHRNFQQKKTFFGLEVIVTSLQ